jgi:hypothetical protein
MRLSSLRTRRGVLVVATLLLGLFALSCEELTTSGPATTVAGETTSTEVSIPATLATDAPPTSATLPAPPTTAPLSTSSEERLPDGHIKACGIIKDVWMDGSVRKLKIDYVDILSGPEAQAAALADGFISPGETLDTDYYVRNNNPKLRTFTVSNSAEIYTTYRNLLVDLDGTPCSWAEFRGFWGPGLLPEGDAHLPDALWLIERDGDTVVWIFQQFMP